MTTSKISTCQLESLCCELGQVSIVLALLAESLEDDSKVQCGAKEEVSAMALLNRVPMYLDTIHLIRRSLDSTRTDLELEINDLAAAANESST